MPEKEASPILTSPLRNVNSTLPNLPFNPNRKTAQHQNYKPMLYIHPRLPEKKLLNPNFYFVFKIRHVFALEFSVSNPTSAPPKRRLICTRKAEFHPKPNILRSHQHCIPEQNTKTTKKFEILHFRKP